MRTSLKQMIVVLLAIALLGAGSVLASPLVQSPNKDHLEINLSERASIFLVEIQKETAALLAEIKKEIAELRPHPYTFGTFAWDPQYTWQNRATFLDRAKGHMSEVAERIIKLQNMRHLVLPWQQQAITQVTSHATRVASSIQAAIARLRENQNLLFISEYREHLTTIAQDSGDMKHVVDKFLDYENTPKEAQRLQYELKLVVH